jgi:hypothetical protein
MDKAILIVLVLFGILAVAFIVYALFSVLRNISADLKEILGQWRSVSKVLHELRRIVTTPSGDTGGNQEVLDHSSDKRFDTFPEGVPIASRALPLSLGKIALGLVGILILAGVISFLVLSLSHDQKPGAGKPHQMRAEEPAKVEDIATGRVAGEFNCSLCEMLPLPSGEIPEYKKVNGVPTWNVQCGGSPGCEGCKVACEGDAEPPQKPGCGCQK